MGHLEHKKLVYEYIFDDSKIALKTVVIGNLILAILFIFNLSVGFISNTFVQYCFFSSLGIVLLYRYYNWRDWRINLSIVLGYALIYFTEFIFYGIPAPVYTMSQEISKGVLLEFVLAMIPEMYACARVLLISPLVYIVYTAFKLERVSADLYSTL